MTEAGCLTQEVGRKTINKYNKNFLKKIKMANKDNLKLGNSVKYLLKRIFNLTVKRKELSSIPEEEKVIFDKIIKEEFSVKFGIAGKAGSGKTTTINALFGTEGKVGFVDIGTEFVEEFIEELGEGKGSVIFYDFPGLEDSIDREKEVLNEYKEYLPKCDVILWVIEATDRKLAFDQNFFNSLDSDTKSRIVIGISKTDQLYPFNWKRSKPSVAQFKNLQKKKNALSKYLGIDKDRIVEYCALKYEYFEEESQSTKKVDFRFNLIPLVAALFKACKIDNSYVLKRSFSEEVLKVRI